MAVHFSPWLLLLLLAALTASDIRASAGNDTDVSSAKAAKALKKHCSKSCKKFYKYYCESPQCGVSGVDSCKVCEKKVKGECAKQFCGDKDKVKEGTCRHPGDISSAKKIGTDYTFGSMVNYICITGYEMTADGNPLICTSKKKWIGTKPTCSKVNCGDPGNPAGTTRRGTDYTYGANVTYTCNTGYARTAGGTTLTCGSNKEWNGTKPTCSKGRCLDPGRKNLTSQSGTTYTVGAMVNYTCITGYEMTAGDTTLTCSNKKTWIGTKPTCSKISCENPGNASAASHQSGTTYIYGANVTYTCISGYKKTAGDNTLTCGSDGNWIGTKPTCSSTFDKIRSCPEVYGEPGRQLSGEYTIYSPSDKPFKVYCLFTGSSNGSTFGFTFLTKNAILNATASGLNIDKLFTTTERALIYYRMNTGAQKRTKITQLSSWSNVSLGFKLNTVSGYEVPKNHALFKPYGSLMLGILPKRLAAARTKQGFRGNGKDYSFLNCHSIPNAYFIFYPNIANKSATFSMDEGVGQEVRLNAANTSTKIPDSYFMYAEDRFGGGGCGGLSMSSSWREASGAALGLPFKTAIKPYSCQDIYMEVGKTTSGEYTILSPTNKPFKVYCLFTGVGNGFMFLSKEAIKYSSHYSIKIGNLYTDTDKALIYYRNKTGGQKTTEITQLSSQSNVSLGFKLNNISGYATPLHHAELKADGSLMLGILPESLAATRTKQGFRGNGKDYSFKNCEAKPNAYFIFYPNMANIRPGFSHDSGIGQEVRLNAANASTKIPDSYFMYAEDQFGGGSCVGLSMSTSWRDASGSALGLPFKYSCLKLEKVSFSTREGTNYTYGANVTYTCITGYEMVGDATLTCGRYKTWIGTKPTCSIVSCGDPGDVSHGSQKGTYTYQSKVTYTCNTGYGRSAGNTTLTCSSNKKWTGTKPTCIKGKDCADLYNKGAKTSRVYPINLSGGKVKNVYCDMTTDGGGWTVFQRRFNGSEDFYQNWAKYQNGFGKADGEYWLGLDAIHALTAGRASVLRVDLQDFKDKTAYAKYGSFSVGNSGSYYKLTVGSYSGNAGDSLSHNSGYKFTTRDKDNDVWSSNCATNNNHGAWWYSNCAYADLNGRYYTSATSSWSGVIWYHWKNGVPSLKGTQMMVRPNSFTSG